MYPIINHNCRSYTYKKVIAIGVSGNEKRHKISPVYVDETEYYKDLPEIRVLRRLLRKCTLRTLANGKNHGLPFWRQKMVVISSYIEFLGEIIGPIACEFGFGG